MWGIVFANWPAKMGGDCGADWAAVPAAMYLAHPQFHAMLFFTLPLQGSPKGPPGEGGSCDYRRRATIARRASASAISTKAEVTSLPPTRMRVGVFILFHS